MSDRPLLTVVQHLSSLLSAPAGAEPTDRELLEEFVRHRAEGAFETLVRRHGPMVQRLARRLASDSHDAEDIFQATFLLLARKAASLSWRESVAGWLYEVGYRTAMNTRANAARRRRYERQAAEMQRAEPISEADRQELRNLLDAELLRLPEKYRTPIVLCYLEGKTNEEAARQLRWPAGTVKGRLARGRDLLRNRLARRGLAPATTALAALLAENTASAALPAPLVLATVRAAVSFTAGQGAAAGVAALVRGTLWAMHTARVKAAALAMLLTAVLAAGGGWAARQASAVPQQAATQETKQQTEAGEGKTTGGKKPAVRVDRHGDALPSGALFRLGTTRLRHGAQVHAVAFSPDDKVVASASDDGTVRLWEPATGKELRRFDLKGNPIHSLAFSPDGRRLAFGSTEIWVYDVATGKQLSHSDRIDSWIESLCFSPNGKILASASNDKLIRFWDPDTAKVLRTVPGHKDHVTSVAFSPDGRALVSASNDNSVRLWEVSTGKEVRQLKLTQARSVTFSPDRKILAAGGWGKEIRLWDLSTGKLLPSLPNPENGVIPLAFSQDSRFLAASSYKTIRLWEIASGKEVRTFQGHQRWVMSAAFSRDGKMLASGGQDNTVRLWDSASGKELHDFSGHQGEVESLAFSPDGKTLATGGGDDAIRLWDTATNIEVRKLTDSAQVSGKAPVPIPGQYYVKTLAFSSDGKSLASAGGDGTIRLWDPATGKTPRRLTAHQSWVNCVAFSPDGKHLASADDRGPAAVHLWDVSTGKLLRQLKGHSDRIYGVAFSPDGKILASGGGGDYEIRLWDAATGKEIRRLTGHDYYIRSLAFSVDGQYLASVTQDGAVFLWEAATGRLLARLRERGRDRAYSVAFSPDGKTLAAADDSGTILLWEAATRKQRLKLVSPQKGISSLAFSPDGRTLATASPDTTVLLWDVTGRRQDGKWVPAPLAEKEIKALWSDLAGQDAARAYRACWRLAAAPQEAVRLVQGQLDLLPGPPSPEKLATLLADLDSAKFRVRNQAFQALEKLGESVEPALRRELNGKVSLERRQRLELLLQELASSPERLRILRTLEVLEQINTPEALQVIRRMSQGPPEAFRTQQARSVLARRFQ